jgi:putative membrane protein
MMGNPEPKSVTDLAVQRTDLAIERTMMAANRTLMAWVRTSTSLTSFGFTIYKFLQQAAASGASKTVLINAQGPKRLGLFLIALGTGSAILGTIEYYHTALNLDKMKDVRRKPLNFSVIVGAAIGLMGLFLFLTILLNAEVF